MTSSYLHSYCYVHFLPLCLSLCLYPVYFLSFFRYVYILSSYSSSTHLSTCPLSIFPSTCLPVDFSVHLPILLCVYVYFLTFYPSICQCLSDFLAFLTVWDIHMYVHISSTFEHVHVPIDAYPFICNHVFVCMCVCLFVSAAGVYAHVYACLYVCWCVCVQKTGEQ